MAKTLITVEDEHGTLTPYSTLKVCCDNNTNFSYRYLRKVKLPYKYKGFYIERLTIINK